MYSGRRLIKVFYIFWANFSFFHVTTLAPLDGLVTFVKNHLAKDLWIYFWIQKSFPFIGISSCASNTLSWLPWLCSKFEIKRYESSYFFIFNNILVILGPFQFHMNFRISLSISTKESAWFLMAIALTCRSVWIGFLS